MIRLYDYWRSSAAYRVRIGLNIKGLSYEQIPINILPGADEQKTAAYQSVNAQGRVPSIQVDGRISGQSMAILEWLEETYPAPPILPSDPWMRLQVRAFADTIACDIHPLNNLSVLAVLRTDFGAGETAIATWYKDWIARGFTALETIAATLPGTDFLFGDAPTLAEIALIPQVANARRFDTDLSVFPRLIEIEQKCLALPAFHKAAPEQNKT